MRAPPIPGGSTQILLMLFGNGEPWEQHYIAEAAAKTLAHLSETRADDNFAALRMRLVELGHHDVADLRPFDGSTES